MSFRLYRQETVQPILIFPTAQTNQSGAVLPSQSFQDVHIYDYTYKESDYKELVTGDKREWMEKLIPLLKNPIAVQGLHLIIANTGTLNNFDTTNRKRAEDLLADLSYAIHHRDTDLLPLLEEQLADMYQLGQCAQGRVTRLWQLRQLLEN